MEKKKFACSLHEVLHGLAPAPLVAFVMLKSSTSSRITTAAMKGDCAVPHRLTTSSSGASLVQGTEDWNDVQATIRDTNTPTTLKVYLKKKKNVAEKKADRPAVILNLSFYVSSEWLCCCFCSCQLSVSSIIVLSFFFLPFFIRICHCSVIPSDLPGTADGK